MTTPHATDREQEAIAAGLSPEEARLLAADAARADQGQRTEQRQRLDFEAWGRQAAERSRPQRQQAAADRTARQERIEELRRDRVVAATLGRLDRRFALFTAEEPSVAAIRRWCVRVARGERLGLVIAGTVGTGKTHEAVAAFRWLLRTHPARVLPAVAVAVPALLDGLRPGRERVEELSACEDARLLLLDDLAAERASDWTAEVLYRLIDARYARNLPTIITTNATGPVIRASLGDRVASRLNGLGSYVVLEGPDRRTPSD
jgi:DNA replication protein DnaC